MTKCFAYLRVSGKSQIYGDGFLRQFRAIRKYCAANDMQIVNIFREKGVTGEAELENRPALSRLFNALEENGVKAVVIERLDRLARDLLVQENLIADMQKSGYNLLSTCEPDLCSEDASRILMRQIFGAIAQYDKAMLVLKLKGARDRLRARHGKCDGRKGWGEKDGEQVILDRMKSLRAEGVAYQAIADTLNAEGVPTRMGKLWKASTIQNILTRKPISAQQKEAA
jgi:DNA invertase Pin-like site-specific DNA recombinase